MINVKIGNIAEFINGVAFKPEDRSVEGKKIIRIQNLTDPSKEYNKTQREVHPKYNVEKGDVLVSWSATIDVFIWNHEDALLNQHIFKVSFDTNKVFKNYFVYALRQTIDELNKLAHVATMRHIIKSDFENHEIPLPSYKDQIKIANLLEKIENLIAERQNSIDLLDELVKATFFQMFGDPVKNEKSWELLNGFEYANEMQVGVVIRPASHYVNEGVIALRSLNIKPNKIDLNDVVRFSEIDNTTTLSKSKLKRNDIVLVRTGNTGVAAIIPEELEGVNCIDLIICRPKSEVINSYYLVYLYNSDRFQKVVENNEVGGVHKHLNVGVLKNIDIPIPPLNLQKQFAAIAQKIETIKSEQNEQKKALEELYASTSQKVFTGGQDLSKVPFNTALLPKESEVIEVIKTIDKQHFEVKPVKPKKTKEKGKTIAPIGKNWGQVSFEEIAEAVKAHFQDFYFNSEMLIRYLIEGLKISVDYFNSSEQKKNLQLENANDFLQFVSGALTGANPFLNLQQIFYNAETENIPNISFKEQDLEILTQKPTKERSGIYFKIRHETTTD